MQQEARQESKQDLIKLPSAEEIKTEMAKVKVEADEAKKQKLAEAQAKAKNPTVPTLGNVGTTSGIGLASLGINTTLNSTQLNTTA